jgi:phage gp46-like protein
MGDYGDNRPQQGDVFLYQSDNEGDITIEGGLATMTTDFDTMAYLVLYGGNADDPGGDDKSRQWWGNFSEPDTAKHYRGEYQHMIEGLAASSGNLRLVEAAAQRDFERAFVDTGIADSVTVTATIPRPNTITLTIAIEAFGDRSEYKYTENWESAI